MVGIPTWAGAMARHGGKVASRYQGWADGGVDDSKQKSTSLAVLREGATSRELGFFGF